MMDTVKNGWALKAQWITLALASVPATYLAYAHVRLTHGAAGFESLCAADGKANCDAVNTSDWSSLFGAPISAYALPMYAVMAYLAWRALRPSARGEKAQGALVILAVWNILVSVFLGYISLVDLGFVCKFCMTMYALHTVSLVLALVPRHRMPALPSAQDLGATIGIGVSVAAVAIGGSLWWAASLDQAVIAEFTATAPTAEQQEVGTALQASGRTRLTGDIKNVSMAAHNPVYGRRDAQVQVIEYADFECGYCRQLSFNLAPIKERYKDRVAFVFRHFPMDLQCNDGVSRTHHQNACEAAMAAHCAEDQGQFWEYHDLLFANQKRLEGEDLEFYADRLGLDLDRWRACTTNGDKRRELLADIESAKVLEISGTPRIYIAGREMRGAVSEAILDAAIRVALGEAELDASGQVDVQRTVVTDEPPPAGAIAMVPQQLGDETFYIDAVEASVDAQGAARSVAGSTPTTVSWSDADAACRASGKRMCSQAEWLAACQGEDPTDDDGDGSVFKDFVEGRLYPYGRYHQEGLCWDAGNQEAGGPREAGSLPGCRTPSGVFDQAGNLQEWVGSSSDRALLAGGAWFYGDKANCGAAYDNFGAGYSNRATGFRCCSDQSVASDVIISGVADAEPTVVGTDVGSPLPAFSGARADGSAFTNSDIDDNVTLINFWASWCTPCQREMPALKAVQDDYADRGFTVLAINVDRQSARAERLLRSVEPNYPVIYDPESTIMGQFDVMAMPTSILVGRDGTVLMQHAGFSDAWVDDLRVQIEAAL
jgi:protein-disulfide isomerase/thiol-disulfide isomerase/thioredoxin